MQVAKNLFLSSDRSYWRKAQELIIATMIEAVWDKQRILEVYLNVAEFGVGVFGIGAAAEHYYKQSAARLNPRQAAWLAAILPAPKRYDKNRQSAWINRKTAIILRRMPQVSVPP
jgi:monofunctional glycosyltransferase